MRQFEHFKSASGLDTKPEENQVNVLLYTMGDNTDDIINCDQI